MAKKDLKSPELYINRELSWLEFNDRVLREGLSKKLPLLERLKFFAIVSSNLDEFFLVRVAGLMQQREAGRQTRDPAGMTPKQQLAAISARTHRMVAEQSKGINHVMERLNEHDLRVLRPDEWSEDHSRFLDDYFARQILPILTPLAVEDLDPVPLLPSLQLHVAAVLTSAGSAEASWSDQHDDGGDDSTTTETGERAKKRKSQKDGKEAKEVKPSRKVVVVPVPSQCPRFIQLPSLEGTYLARLEDLVAERIVELFPGCPIHATAIFRITRDADVAVLEDEADDLLQAVEEAVLDRRRRAAVRLEISAAPNPQIKDWLVNWLKLKAADVYEIGGMLDAKALMEILEYPGFAELKDVDWPPQPPRDLLEAENLWETLQEHDVLLSHPYETFDPVVQLIEQAAEDPHVLAIKQTLYRTSGNSPIVQALQHAAENGKEVTVLVELRARFDEARNVNWARRLEDAGCHVIYGIAGYKTHGKALLIVRRESQRIRRYVHLATGNYNDKTAQLYCDVGLITCDAEIAADVAAFFNLLTGYSETVGWSKIIIAPTGLKQRFLDLIEREIQASTPDKPGLIMAKMNSLEDTDICRALYRASQAGVKVMLNIRGICCLRPGVKGVSKQIEVCSIIDRFLEHARVFYFRNGGHEEVYLSSADWMRRNLVRRLEILFPVSDPGLRRRLVRMLETCFADNTQSHSLQADGTYEPVQRTGKRVRAQQVFHQEAVDAVRATEHTASRFKPLGRPRDE